MGYTISVTSVQQARQNLQAVLEIMELLWLHERPDIEANNRVPAGRVRAPTTSRALATVVVRTGTRLLEVINKEQAASSTWVLGHQDQVRVVLKRYENFYGKNAPLHDVSLPLKDRGRGTDSVLTSALGRF